MDAKATRRRDRRRTDGPTLLHDGPNFDAYRGGEEERAGGVVYLRRGLRDDEATKGGAKSGPSCGEDLARVHDIIRVEQLLDLLHRQDRQVRKLHAEIGRFR
jgi:hypothetical protein